VHLATVAGFDNRHIEQVQVPLVVAGDFIPAAAQSKLFTVGAACNGLADAGGVEKLKVGNEELGMAFTAFRVLSK